MVRRINQTRSEGIDGDKWERLLADVRGHLWAYGDFTKIAHLANLSAATISNLAYGDTKSPHLRTVFKIMSALGKSDPILKAFESEKPLTLHALAKRWVSRQKLRQARKAKIRPVKTRASTRRLRKAVR